MEAWFAPVALGVGDERDGICFPELCPEALKTVMIHLRGAGEVLRGLPVQRVAEALGRVAQAWRDEGMPERREALEWLPRLLPFTRPVCARALDEIFAPITPEGLLALLGDLFGDPFVLDRFVPRGKGRHVRAFGAEIAFLILPGNIVGVGIWDIFFCLLCKTPVLVKPSLKEPLLPNLLARSLSRIAPELSGAIAVLPWSGAEAMLTGTALNLCEVVIVYGTDETIAAVKAKAPPKVRVIGRGDRRSFVLVASECADEMIAFRLAHDLARFDQRGCLSPQVCFVEGEKAKTFARWIAEALEWLANELPPPPTEAVRASVTQFRLTGEILGGEAFFAPDAGYAVLFWSDDLTAWRCLSCPGRVLHVVAVPSLDVALEMMRPFSNSLQGVALAVPEGKGEALATALGVMGVSRICPVGSLQTPPIEWHQDGRHLLTELIRWCDWEPPEPLTGRPGWIEVFWGDEETAFIIRGELEERGIPTLSETDFDPLDFLPRQRLFVPPDFADEVRRIIEGLGGGG